MTDLTLGKFYGIETLLEESKEFHLQVGNIFNEEILIDIIENGSWNKEFSLLIESNIWIYINKFFPKYVSCAYNSKILLKLAIGVDDWGEITGIPYDGELDKSIIQNYIDDSINQNINCDLNKKDIQINLIKLKTDPNILNDEIEILYKKYMKKIREVNDNMLEYKKKKSEWLTLYEIYSQRLEILINTTTMRKEIIEYIKSFNLGTEVQNVINLLESEEVILIPTGIEVSIARSTENINNVIYWLVEWKDYRTAELVKIRPKKPIINQKYDLYTLVSNLSLLRLRFVKNKINYYLLEITINGENNKPENEVKYKLNGSDKWISRRRGNGMNGPFSY